jgi:hypothetical protein
VLCFCSVFVPLPLPHQGVPISQWSSPSGSGQGRSSTASSSAPHHPSPPPTPGPVQLSRRATVPALAPQVPVTPTYHPNPASGRVQWFHAHLSRCCAALADTAISACRFERRPHLYPACLTVSSALRVRMVPMFDRDFPDRISGDGHSSNIRFTMSREIRGQSHNSSVALKRAR